MKSAIRFAPLLLLLHLAPAARAQSVVAVSAITAITSSTVSTYSATEMDYYTAYWYDAETDAYLAQNNSLAQSGSIEGNPSAVVGMTAPMVLNSTYFLQTIHWLVGYYVVYIGDIYWATDEYGYSLLSAGDYPGQGFIAPFGTFVYTIPELYEIGITYDEADTNVPSISGINVLGSPVRGGSGYVEIYGSDLTQRWGATSVNIDGNGVSNSITYSDPGNPGQVNISYTIAATANTGPHNLTLTTQYGTSNAVTFTVDDPTPVITSISPDTWQAGTTTPFTISGSGFGSNPSLSISGAGVTSFQTTNASDTQLTGSVTIDSSNAGTDVTVVVTANGFGGNSFTPAQPGQSQQTAAPAHVAPVPAGVQITNADIYGNDVAVVLTGPSASGTLNVTLQGPSPVQLGSQSATPGTYHFSFNRPNLPLGQYSAVQASWTVGSTTGTGSSSVAFNVIGLTRFSTYNTPYESQCSGGQSTAYLITDWNGPTCHWTTAQLNSNFMSQTTTNGTGVSLANGTLKAYGALPYCELPPGGTSSTTFYEVPSITGSCNTTPSGGGSIATFPFPSPSSFWNCSDQVLLVNGSNQNDSVKTVQDACPACSGGFGQTNGHIDTYSSSMACGAHSLGDYGNFYGIRLR